MPNLFLKPCQYPGCREYATRGSCYCEAHAKQYENTKNRHRISKCKQGYGRRWEKAREAFLIENPLCVECQKHGRYTPATEVDHIIPHRGDQNLFWDRKNWQSLCHSCHSKKTAKEDGGFGNGRKTT